jgi:ribosome-binding factor A
MARVFYTSLGDEKARKETSRALQRATGFFRRQIGSRLQLRRVPEIEFRFDESIANQDRIEQILRDIHEEDAQRASESGSQDALARPSSTSEGGDPEPRPDDRHGD